MVIEMLQEAARGTGGRGTELPTPRGTDNAAVPNARCPQRGTVEQGVACEGARLFHAGPHRFRCRAIVGGQRRTAAGK